MNSLPEQQQQQQLVEQQEEGKEKEHSQQQPPQQQQQQEQEQSTVVVIPETSDIKRLDDATVRRITAEQAISDLASIVKELIDNSLDAESTTIKSKFKFYKVFNVLIELMF
jgi:small-conductance mechanosensitive channel